MEFSTLINSLSIRFSESIHPANPKLDRSICNHNNRRTQWYQLTTRYGDICLVPPTKQTNYGDSLQNLARIVKTNSRELVLDYNLSVCRRCRKIIFNCKGCDKLTEYDTCYIFGSGSYNSYWCSRFCFEDNH